MNSEKSEFEKEYMTLFENDAPDLWARIESNLPEKNVEEPVVSKKKKKGNIIKYFPVFAAAAVVLVSVPLIILNNVGEKEALKEEKDNSHDRSTTLDCLFSPSDDVEKDNVSEMEDATETYGTVLAYDIDIESDCYDMDYSRNGTEDVLGYQNLLYNSSTEIELALINYGYSEEDMENLTEALNSLCSNENMLSCTGEERAIMLCDILNSYGYVAKVPNEEAAEGGIAAVSMKAEDNDYYWIYIDVSDINGFKVMDLNNYLFEYDYGAVVGE